MYALVSPGDFQRFVHSFIHSVMYLLIQQIFVEHPNAIILEVIQKLIRSLDNSIF